MYYTVWWTEYMHTGSSFKKSYDKNKLVFCNVLHKNPVSDFPHRNGKNCRSRSKNCIQNIANYLH